MMRFHTTIALCLAGTYLSSGLRAENWPQFRGPNNAGLAMEAHLPPAWAAEKNFAWKIRIPGYGWSSPIVWSDKLFVTTAVSNQQQPPERFAGAGGGAGGPAGGGPGAFGPRARPLLTPAALDRLQLTDKQKEQVEKLQKEFADQQQGQLAKAGQAMQKAQGDKDPEAMPKALEKLREAFQGSEKARGDYLAKLRDFLTDGQKKSFDQLQKEESAATLGGLPGMGPAPKPPDQVYRWEIYCLNAADGKVLWKQLAHEGKPPIPKQPSNTYASETPVTDGERVYAYFGMVGVFCYDFAGQLLWSKDLGSYPMMMGWGTGSSPALDGDRLFVQCDNEKDSFLVALDKKTGQELWRVGRDEKSSWCTPFIWRNKQRTELVAAGPRRVRSYDPATGRLLWQLEGMTRMTGSTVASATPVADEDRVYVSTGSSFGTNPLFAVRAGASGDLTLPEGTTASADVAWSLTRGGPSMASPLLYGGYLYTLDDNSGLLSCYEATTGKPAYRERLLGARGFSASPWVHADKVFCLDREGRTFVIQAGPTFRMIGKNDLGEMCWATPALANGSLFLRSSDHLYSIH
jgi:outer membrane protein assembly factor BamB